MLFEDGSQDWKHRYLNKMEWMTTVRKAYPTGHIVYTQTKIPQNLDYISATILNVEIAVWRGDYGLIYSPLQTNLVGVTLTSELDLYDTVRLTEQYRFESNRSSVASENNKYIINDVGDSVNKRGEAVKRIKKVFQKIPDWLRFGNQ